ncbi:hypothetical protein N665_0680s0003 [Sinapis alba]|nr:hypothetical protein N665_0680s0003 [Sinapis alba]
MKGAYTNKHTREIQDVVMKNVIDLVETQVEEVRASQLISDDDSSASNNLTRDRINEMVIKAVPKKKDRLVGLGLRAGSSSSQPPISDPVIMEELREKTDRIEALETQNATILAQMVEQKSTLELQSEQVAETQRLNREFLEKMKELFPTQF